MNPLKTTLKMSCFLLTFTSAVIAKEAVQTTPQHIPEFKTVWQKAYGDEKRDKAYDVVALPDGGAMVAGMSRSYGKGRSDMLIVKLDKEGKTEFRSSFGGKKKDHAFGLARASDGHFFAVGSTESFTNDGDKDMYVVKFDINGNRLWQNHYGGANNEEAMAVAAVNGGGALVAGYTDSYGKGRKDVYLIYIDKDGKEIWSKAIGGTDDDEATDISLTADGGFVVVGATESYGAGSKDFYILKFDGKGKLLWDKVYGEVQEDVLNGVAPTPDGGFVVTGKTKSFGSKHSDIDIIKYDKVGTMQWHKIYGFDSKEWGNDIIRIPGGYLIVGTTKSFGFGGYDIYLIELDANGSSKWANVYGGEDKDIGNAAARLKNGSVLVVGETESYGMGDYDFMLIELEKR